MNLIRLIELSFSSSFFILAIVLVRFIFKHTFSKRVFVGLGTLAFIRLVVPFTFTSSLNVFNIFVQPMKNTTVVSVTNRVVDTLHLTNQGMDSTTNLNTNLNSLSTTNSSVPFLLIVWVIGFLIVMTFFLSKHIKAKQLYNQSFPVVEPFIIEWKSKNRFVRTVDLRTSSFIDAPLTYGIFNPIILLPKTIDFSENLKITYILAHEYSHIRHFDVLKKWFALLVCSIHWFNPIVWLMFYIYQIDIELACDEDVIKQFGETSKSTYAKALVSLEEQKRFGSPLMSHFSKNSLEERIKAIMKTKKKTWFIYVISTVVVISTILVFGSNPKKIVKEQINQTIEDKIAHSDVIYFKVNNVTNVLDPNDEVRINPYISPVKNGRVSSRFGERYGKFHTGIDIAGVDLGAPIYAIEDGKVSQVGYNPTDGYYVILTHSKGHQSIYKHCDEINVHLGDFILQGDQIATVGNSGNTRGITGVHLHLEIKNNQEYIDPLQLID